jgi:hypothetical protein
MNRSHPGVQHTSRFQTPTIGPAIALRGALPDVNPVGQILQRYNVQIDGK